MFVRPIENTKTVRGSALALLTLRLQRQPPPNRYLLFWRAAVSEELQMAHAKPYGVPGGHWDLGGSLLLRGVSPPPLGSVPLLWGETLLARLNSSRCKASEGNIWILPCFPDVLLRRGEKWS